MDENLTLHDLEKLFEPFLTLQLHEQKNSKVFHFHAFLQALIGDEEINFFIDDQDSIKKACKAVEDKYPFLFRYRQTWK